MFWQFGKSLAMLSFILMLIPLVVLGLAVLIALMALYYMAGAFVGILMDALRGRLFWPSSAASFLEKDGGSE
jgi:hypothetical protein